MSPRKVRVLVLATEEEVDVAPNYPVFEIDTAQKEAGCEEACVECDAPEPTVDIEAAETECESDEIQVEPKETVASEQDEPQDEPQESEPEKMRVSLDNLEKSKQKKPPTKAAKKVVSKKKEAKIKKDVVAKPDTTPKQGMTTKQLVTNMLMQGQQTRESLAQAIVDAKLSKNNSVKKVKSYVSIILHELKKTNKNFVSLGPGRYEIKK